jgi:hypothetical protein
MIANILLQQTVEMADGLRSEGKIYVVVAVVTIVTLGLIAYLFSIDRKISKIEKDLKK